MAVEQLKVDIQVADISKFKQDIRAAEIAINDLQKEYITTGSSSKKLAKDIKLSRLALRRQKLDLRAATDEMKINASQAIKTGAANRTLAKSSKRTGMAMQQIAYGLDDMQYGFRGVQNNLQQFAINMGASGGVVIGLTLVAMGVQKLIDKFEKQKKATKEAAKALREKQGLLANMMTYAQVVKTSAEGSKEHEDALKKLADNGYDRTSGKIDEYIVKLKKQMLVESQLAAQKDKLKRLLTETNEATAKIKELEADGMTSEKAYQKTNRGDFKGGALAAQYRKAQALIKKNGELIEETVVQAGELAKTVMGTDVKGESEYTKKIKELKEEIIETDAELEELLRKGQPLLEQEEMDARKKLFGDKGQFEDPGEQDAEYIDLDGIDLDDETQAYLENLKLMIESTNDLRDNVGGAFGQLGGVIAQNLGNSGSALSAFLGAAIGTYTKLLSTNKAFLAKLIPMKATEAGVNAVASGTETASKIPFGAFALPALIGGALAAVSSAFSSVGASSGGGGGGGGSVSKPSAVMPSLSNPQRQNGSPRVRGGDLVLPLDKVRYGMQGADDNYSGQN